MSHQDDDSIDQKRREFLTGATVAMGAIGVAAACIPFVASMLPNAETIAASGPVRVKVSDMKPGDQLTVIWRGKPVWIVARGDAALNTLKTNSNLLRDPNSEVDQQPIYAQNIFRSRKPLHLILVGVCTHLGCTPTYRPDPHSVTPDWLGGFFCSCHGSKFDLSGRVYKNVPAPINLEVPPYVYLSDDEILIGESEAPT